MVNRLSGKIKAAPKKKKEEKKPEVRGKKWSFEMIKKLIGEHLSVLRWLMKEFKGIIVCESLHSHITIGLGYPHITGMIVGFLYALNGLLPDKYSITPHWNFTKQVISGNCTLRITVKAYILWYKLFTIVPAAGYRQRARIKYWFNVIRHKNSLQEA
ncbi:MAG: DUF2953 domain-containing protein [Candidatus Latescibacteria bacterium]|nr:DUF2953 domain-containing protein [Candidatus Latescibacterota bacterium]